MMVEVRYKDGNFGVIAMKKFQDGGKMQKMLDVYLDRPLRPVRKDAEKTFLHMFEPRLGSRLKSTITFCDTPVTLMTYM